MPNSSFKLPSLSQMGLGAGQTGATPAFMAPIQELLDSLKKEEMKMKVAVSPIDGAGQGRKRSPEQKVEAKMDFSCRNDHSVSESTEYDFTPIARLVEANNM